VPSGFVFNNPSRYFIETKVGTFFECHFIILHSYFSLHSSLQFTYFHQFSGGFINCCDRNVLVWGNKNCMFVDRTTATPLSSDKEWHTFSYSSFSGKTQNTRGAMSGLYGRCCKTVKPRWWLPAFPLLLWGLTSLCCIKTCCMSGQTLEISCLQCLQYSSVALRLVNSVCTLPWTSKKVFCHRDIGEPCQLLFDVSY
jgi:hypothetical protein